MKKHIYILAVVGLLMGCGANMTTTTEGSLVRSTVSKKSVLIYKNIDIAYAAVAKEVSIMSFSGDFNSQNVSSSIGCKYLGFTFVGSSTTEAAKVPNFNAPLEVYVNTTTGAVCIEVDMSKTTMSDKANLLHSGKNKF